MHSMFGFIDPVLAVTLAVPVLGTGSGFAECLVLVPALLQTAQLGVRTQENTLG